MAFTGAYSIGATAGALGSPAAGSKVVPLYWADFVRSNLYTSLYFRQLGTKVTIPRGMGDAVKIPRWKTVFQTTGHGRQAITGGKSGTMLTAIGVTGEATTVVTPQAMDAESISGTVMQFKGARGYNDKVVIVSYADFIEGALESLTKELAFRVDAFTRQKISAHGTLIYISSGMTKSASGTVIRGKSVAQIPAIFDSQNVPRWDDDTHLGVVHPLVQFDIYRDISANGWINIAQYGDPERIYRGEIGQMYGVRFLCSAALPVTWGTAANSATLGLSGKATGSNAYFFAPDAFYSLELEDGGVEVIHHELGSAGAYDPVNNIGTIGVKCFYGVIPAPAADYRLLRMPHGFGLSF